MTTYLSLTDASIVRLKGWGRAGKPSDYEYRLEFADFGLLAVYGASFLREKQVLAMSIENLEITASIEQVTAPGGYRATSFSDIILESSQPRRLKPVPGKTTEYTLLRTREILPNGAQREADVALRSLPETKLRDQLAPALHAWADAYVKASLNEPPAGPTSQPALQPSYDKADRMQERGILDSKQALLLRSHASKPLVAAIVRKLRAGHTTPDEAQRLRSEITEMQTRGRLTDRQAHEINDALAAVSSPSRANASGDRLHQIQILHDLRTTGALTEAEFQAEKARLLREDD